MGELFQPTHLLIIGVVLLLLFGGRKLPELGKGLGEGLKGFKDGLKGQPEDDKHTAHVVTPTPDQEKKWDAVAKVMRSNAESSRAQVMEKRKDEATMTAVADLNAYADIAEAHAKHVRKLAKVFAELYDTMTPDQKKTADEVFREHKRKSSEDQAQ